MVKHVIQIKSSKFKKPAEILNYCSLEIRFSEIYRNDTYLIFVLRKKKLLFRFDGWRTDNGTKENLVGAYVQKFLPGNQLIGVYCWMKWAFSIRLNWGRDSAFLIWAGISFQTLGPCTLMDWLVSTNLLNDGSRLSRKRVEQVWFLLKFSQSLFLQKWVARLNVKISCSFRKLF